MAPRQTRTEPRWSASPGIVRHDRPLSEVLTGDYLLVNPFSAVAFGVRDRVAFQDASDPREWRSVTVGDPPLAGILTDAAFLARYPTSDTNVNRKRSKAVWGLFLATDLMNAGERPLDVSQAAGHNPTLNSPACAVCHVLMDPVAGAFQNWDARGRYRPPAQGWHAWMRPPGFDGAEIPPDQEPRSLQWLARRIVQDRRFAVAAVSAVYQGLVGRAPLTAPTDPDDPQRAGRIAFYRLEQAFLAGLADRLVANELHLRTIIPEVLRSPFYRAVAPLDATPADLEALGPLGTQVLLWPERLSRRIETLTGHPWKRRAADPDPLLDPALYNRFYGGVDADRQTQRVDAPNGVMANIALRMATEMGCLLAPWEFSQPAATRHLLPLVEPGVAPEDRAGRPDPDHTIRAWSAVITYMFADWRVLYQ